MANPQIVDLTARLTLTLAREQAELASAILQTWEIGTKSGLAQAGLQAGQAYNDEAQDLRRRAGEGEQVDTASLGSPHIRVWTEVVNYMGRTFDPGAERDYLEKYYKEIILSGSAEKVADSIPIFRVRKNKGKEGGATEKCRFQFQVKATDTQLETIIVRALRKEGAIRKIGSAPRGALERELGRLVNS